MIVLKLLGTARIEHGQGALTGPAVQRHRLALIALLVMARSHTVPREKLMSMLWPERDGEHVRNLLKQAVYVLRKTFGESALFSTGDSLRLDPGAMQCDVIDFEQAISSGEFEKAIALYAGPFLDGFFLSGAQEFESWVIGERSRLADAYATALEALAEKSAARGDTRTAIEWSKALVKHDSYNTPAVLRLMRFLEAAGDPAAAVACAETHARILREELGIKPPSELADMVGRMQGLPRGAHAAQSRAESAVIRTATEPETPATIEVRDLRRGSSLRRIIRPALYAAVLGVAVLLVSQFAFLLPDRRSPVVVTSTDQIAQAVAEEFDRRLRGDPATDKPARRTSSIAAYEWYLRGNDPTLLRSPATARQALDNFRQAVDLDPSYAAAWAGMARLSLRVANDGGDDEQTLREFAEQAALTAIGLDDTLAEAHAVMGLLRMFVFDFKAAEWSLRRAVVLDPSLTSSREWLVGLYLWTGRNALALTEAERATQLDPLSPSASAELARVLAASGRCDEALVKLENLANLDPPLLRVPLIAAQCHVHNGSWQSAVEALTHAPATVYQPLQQAMLGYVLARSGQHDAAHRVRDSLHDSWQQGRTDAIALAVVFAGLEDLDQAFVWLERARDDRSLVPTPDQFTLLHPILEQLRGDPRLASLSMLTPSHGAQDR